MALMLRNTKKYEYTKGSVLRFFQKHKVILILLVILAVAGFFRLWGLETIPPGLYPDEAINGNQAISEAGKIFYPENNGREGFLWA